MFLIWTVNIDMMNEHDVITLLNKTKNIGVEIWIDGGWGVDALVGSQSRPHNDIDVFIEKRNAEAFIGLLSLQCYSEVQMEHTTDDHTTWKDSSSRIVDLHLFEFAEDGNLIFDHEAYPAHLLGGTGKIGGIDVQCLSVEAQLLYHQGYENDENDIRDVLLLCKTFGLEIPGAYKV